MLESCLIVSVLAVAGLSIVGLITLVRAATSSSHGAPARVPTSNVPARCRHCGRIRGRERCLHCGLAVDAAGEWADWQATLDHLADYRDAGLIDESLFAQLRKYALDRSDRLLGRRRPAVAAVAASSEAILEALPVEAPPAATAVPAPAVAPPIPEVAVETAPAEPRRGWLAAFMEERHILWGELVGGLLVVGCSVALVLSLWQTLQQIPLFPFLILAALSSVLFGVGRYTLRRWKLEATSRGLLVIALLMVPLNFLVLAGLGQSSDAPIELLIKCAAVPWFAWLVYRAGCDLFPGESPGLLTLGVVGASVGSFLLPMLIGDTRHVVLLLALPALPVLCHAASLGLTLARRWRDAELEPAAAWQMLGQIALATFPLPLAFGFVLLARASHGGDLTELLIRLAPVAALAAASVSAVGLFAMQRSRPTAHWPMFIGTGLALLGLLAQAGALALGWPGALAVIAIGLVIYAGWSAAALAFRLPPAHAWAIAGLSATVLAAVQFAGAGSLVERLQWTRLVSSESGIALAALALALVVVADLTRVRGAWNHGVVYAVSAGVVMAAGLALAARHAVVLPARAAGTGIVAIAAGLLLAWRWNVPRLAQAALALVGLTTAAALHGLMPGRQDFWATLIAAEVVAFVLLNLAAPAPLIITAVVSVGCALAASDARSLAHPLTATLLALATLVEAQRRRLAPLALVGSALVLLAAGHLWWLRPQPSLPLAAPLALVTHAVVMLPFVLWRRRLNGSGVASVLALTGEATSILAALALLLRVETGAWLALAASAAGLAVLWLAYALAQRRPAWLAAAQAASAAAAVFAVGRGLNLPLPFEQVVTLHFEPVALALCAVAAGWAMLRLAVDRPAWQGDADLGFDRLLPGVLLFGMIVISVGRLLPGLAVELLAAPASTTAPGPVEYRLAGLPLEWLLLTALAAVILLNLWLARRTLAHGALLAGLIVTAMTAAVIAARSFAGQGAAASALRWGMGLVYLLGCAAFWVRHRLRVVGETAGLHLAGPDEWRRQQIVPALRDGVLALAALVPLVLTFIAIGRIIAGEPVPLPAIGSFFRGLGFTASHALPLALVAVGLVGHAVRERSAVYALLGGLVALFVVGGGYLVEVTTAGRALDNPVAIELIQRLTMTALGWALGWLLVAHQMGRLRIGPAAPSGLWRVQLAGGVAGLLLLLVPAALALAVDARPDWLPLLATSGTWAALGLLLLTAYAWSRLTGARVESHLAGLVALAALVPAACLIPAEHAAWSFTALLVGWSAVCATMMAVNSSHRSAWFTGGGILIMTLVALGFAAGPQRHWESAPLFAAFLLTAALALRRAPAETAPLSGAALFGLGALALSGYLALSPQPLGIRLLGPLAVACLTTAAALLPPRVGPAPRHRLHLYLALVVLTGIAIGWALVAPLEPGPWLHRLSAALVVLAAASVLCGFVRPRWLGDAPTGQVARTMSLAFGQIALGLLVVILTQQAFLYDTANRHTPLSGVETVLAALAIAGLLVATLAAAIEPYGRSFGLSWPARRGAVYVAEVLLAALFFHLRLNVPGLFPRIEAQTWAFLIMAIAFLGVGASEAFRRYRLEVLVRPLRHTGLFLPLLPLLMFWMKPSPPVRAWLVDVIPGSQPMLSFFDQIPTDFGKYALMWWIFGAIFALLAISQRSFRFSLASALAANVGLWSLLQDQGVSFLVHPQVWLVPLALIVLAAEWYQREHLRADESAALRYLGLGMLYLSSTADMFIAGLGNSALMPLVLALLAVAGVMTGILLRVRAYLFLGTGFLAVVVLSMIWYAAVDLSHTWLWWGCGVLLGAAILTVFALIEKRRLSVAHLIDELRTWR